MKRVIAIPGDTICITATAVVLNGSQLHEPYIFGGNESSFVALPCQKLGADPYFVMGDNRLNSSDSRDFGPVTLDSIIGKVVGIFG